MNWVFEASSSPAFCSIFCNKKRRIKEAGNKATVPHYGIPAIYFLWACQFITRFIGTAAWKVQSSLIYNNNFYLLFVSVYWCVYICESLHRESPSRNGGEHSLLPGQRRCRTLLGSGITCGGKSWAPKTPTGRKPVFDLGYQAISLKTTRIVAQARLPFS